MMLALGFLVGLVGSAILLALVLKIARTLEIYEIVPEGQCKVLVLFGKVICVLNEPGLHLLFAKLGVRMFLFPFFGKKYDIDIRLDQEYLRSQPVNSEEGTPMGVGVWYEMRVTNPVDFLFKNNDPRGSLRANVSSAAVRCLSNLPLAELLTSRHAMSRIVRTEVSPRAEQWGYNLGSIYIRKVHFRDESMIRQIEQKVGNRLLQVTSAIRQAGANQVDVIKSTADKEAATEFAKAASMRPQIVGHTLDEIAQDPKVLSALLEILEIQKMVKSDAHVTLVPQGTNGQVLNSLLSAK